jgi:hypothetical protein
MAGIDLALIRNVFLEFAYQAVRTLVKISNSLKRRIMPKQAARFVKAAVTSLLLFVPVAFTVGASTPPRGVYSMSIVAEDIPANVPVEARNHFVGKWQMTFAKENGYQISKDGKVLVEGHLTPSTEQIKFKDERGDLACTQEPEMVTGSYKLSYQDKKLTFTLVSDKCEGRRFVLTVHPWFKESQDHASGIQGPPTPAPTPPEDTARYVAWMEKEGKPLSDKPHEIVSLRAGDWGFFYHGERTVGSWTPLQDRTAVDRSGHAVTEKENGDWFALLSSSGLDASSALKRVAWLFNADGLISTAEPRAARRSKATAPVLASKDGVITFQGWCMAHSDPPYEMRITIVATPNGAKLVIDSASKL